MLLRIDERLPDSPLESEVVLHVRRHARAAVRRREPTASWFLALLFGFDPDDGDNAAWRDAMQAAAPLQAGAAVARRLRPSNEGAVSLGHDAEHVAACRRWLLARKARDDVFAHIEATDLATLLELSKARDIACAHAIDARGIDRYLPVLIQGPTGSGKELLALALHELWKCGTGKPDAPFQVVHVGGMTADMINDELFGHARGAYTGADKGRSGRLESANGGTLLIDEVGDLPFEAQVRLLRFLQTQVVSRIGENNERQLSVRIIAATWHDLDAAVAAGRFREDLLHRLRVGAGIRLPPLASREGFFDEVLPALLRRRRHTATPPLTRSARDALEHHRWPGNLRELTGTLDEVVALAEGETIRLEHLPSHIQRPYLELPLHERVRGFLLDEVDGGGLPDDHVTWRIEQVNHSLAAVPLPPTNEQLATIQEFLTLVADDSDADRLAIAQADELLGLGRQLRAAEGNCEFWRKVLTGEIPENVGRLVRAAAERADATRAELAGRIQAVHEQSSIEAHPWLRLLHEVQSLPLLKSMGKGEFVQAFVALLNLLKLLAPTMVEQIRDDVSSGGVGKIRERLKSLLAEPGDPDDDPDVIDVEQPAKPPGKLSRVEWEEIANFSTQTEAVEHTRYDPKTINKYLEKYDIPNPWRAPRRPRPE
ncbi:sigma 54-interacting transcriptional regulator [Nannocystis pusilla]|uniref:sigma 54-interacting transcriptional regulator n=1 Tax=Nannocystis pusilla TaxID=889268 RepID=UPI003BF3E7D5